MRKIFFSLIVACMAASGWANDITVSNVTLSGHNSLLHTANINFDVSLKNSWRTSTNESNYDGAWLFAKVRVNGTYAWQHCTLKLLGAVAAPGAILSVSGDQLGAFLYRSSDGIGNIDFPANQLIWDYGADGIADNATVEIKIFALEMVFVPSGAYWLGTNAAEANSFQTGTSTAPYEVTSANAIPVNDGNGLSFNGLGSGTSVPSTFPNGFDGFWVMKYECSQQQYADFLNTLTSLQVTNLNTSPYNITGDYPAFEPVAADRIYTDFSKNTAAKKLTSFAEWAGLRPLSEMEFEKTCRGVNIPPYDNEFACGSDDISVVSAMTDVGMPNEAPSAPLDANAYLYEIFGSLGARVGSFARLTNSSRLTSGAGYYGVMNMSDNGYEMVVAAGTDEGRAISKTEHGSGALDTNGFTSHPAWQNPDAFMRRGGSYRSGVNAGTVMEFARVSNRSSITNITTPVADGIRLARTAY